MNASQKTKTSVKRQAGVASDLTQIVEASQQMENMLDTILGYVDKVLSGASTPDNAFGRSLLDMVHSVPKMTTGEFEEMLNSNRKVRTQPIIVWISSEIIHIYKYYLLFCFH